MNIFVILKAIALMLGWLVLAALFVYVTLAVAYFVYDYRTGKTVKHVSR